MNSADDTQLLICAMKFVNGELPADEHDRFVQRLADDDSVCDAVVFATELSGLSVSDMPGDVSPDEDVTAADIRPRLLSAKAAGRSRRNAPLGSMLISGVCLLLVMFGVVRFRLPEAADSANLTPAGLLRMYRSVADQEFSTSVDADVGASSLAAESSGGGELPADDEMRIPSWMLAAAELEDDETTIQSEPF